MKLVNFSVSNFRSITSAHKIPLGSTTILIGKNNEGKSNILKSLQVAMQILQEHSEAVRRRVRTVLTGSEPYSWKRDFPILLQNRRGKHQTIFKLEFLLDEDEISQFKSEIGCNLNGSLPLEIRIGKENIPNIVVVKPGKGTKTLSTQSNKIAHFIARRIFFNYIPAIRTDKEAIELIGKMLSRELLSLESNPDYISALNTIADLQQPILNELANSVLIPLREFLPSINSVSIEIPESTRRVAIRRDFNVVIDDGTPTNIEYKGDGVKSLATLGLLKSRNSFDGASILAIEEPESHLHSGAIHQVNEIIKSISETSQVLITTHNPLFVDRSFLKSNIIVSDGSATPAKHISIIRDTLGIKASDNLTNSNYALVVEGKEDVIALKAILPILSSKLEKALKSNLLVIDPIGGAGSLSYKLSLLKNSLCLYHALLDADGAGKTAYKKAKDDSLISEANCTFVMCNGMEESEFEDCINPDIYKDAVLELFGVDINQGIRAKKNKKFSERIKGSFINQGKLWDEKTLPNVKYVVAKAIEKNPKNALHQHKRSSIDALITSLERMINF